MKKIVILLVLLSIGMTAQQDLMVSQYMFNGLFLNPAYAGSHKYISSSLLYRDQWVNFPGAPKTALVAVDGPVEDLNIGLGLIVANDRIGVTEQTDLYGNYAYQLRLGEGKLAFGIRAGASNYQVTNSDLTVWDENDEMFTGRNNFWIPKLSFGTYYFAETWYAGLAVPNLLAYDPMSPFSLDVDQSSFVRRHYFLNGGYVFKLNRSLKLKPSVLVKYTTSAPLQGDLNLNLFFMDQFCIGGSYRSGDAFTLMAEYQAKRFRVGYAYDFTTSRIRKYSAGSHEIMIGFDFGRDIIKFKTPRYF
jgi:type IX secretion system PorP/SprF family membrane protein